MSGTRGLVCALGVSAVLVFVSGCAVDNAFALFAFSPGKEHLFPGERDVVAAAADVALKNMKLQAQITPEGESIKVASATRSGKKFFLYLSSVDGGQGGPRTKVRIVWQDGAEDAFWFQFLEGLAEAHLQITSRNK